MFVGRTEELAKLERLYRKGSFQMVVVYGRRRVGKTALIRRFGEGKELLYFTALDQSDKDNLADFSLAVYEFFGAPLATGQFLSWKDAFDYLAEKATERRFVLAFDEFPYAASRSESLPSVLQIAIDHKLKDTGLYLILCGSDQGFMESEVLGRKSPLYGRRTAQLKLTQLDYLEVAQMLPARDADELFRYYGCFGGVPYYLEQIDPELTLEENLRALYFDPTGFLYDEPYGLLRQEFREPALYNSILRAIAEGANRPSLMADKTGIEVATLPRYLKSLCSLEIIEKIVPFGENPERSRKGIYRIRDACYDFWFHFVMARTSEIELGMGGSIASRIMGGALSTYLGHRFEDLCRQWLIAQARTGRLPLPATLVGAWWGADPDLREQTDIDVLAADPDGKDMLIGECKYRESFDESLELDDLARKRDIVKGYHATDLYLFTKHEVSAATRSKYAAQPDVHFVSLEDMYRDHQ